MPEAQPWDPRPGEPDNEHAAFRLFLDLGAGRSVAGVAAATGQSLALLERWAQRWKWQVRAQAWDEHLVAGAMADQVQAGRDMAERQVQESLLLQQKALTRLKTLSPDELSAADAIRMLSEGARLEREARRIRRELTRPPPDSDSPGPGDTLPGALLHCEVTAA